MASIYGYKDSDSCPGDLSIFYPGINLRQSYTLAFGKERDRQFGILRAINCFRNRLMDFAEHLRRGDADVGHIVPIELAAWWAAYLSKDEENDMWNTLATEFNDTITGVLHRPVPPMGHFIGMAPGTSFTDSLAMDPHWNQWQEPPPADPHAFRALNDELNAYRAQGGKRSRRKGRKNQRKYSRKNK